MTELPEEPRPTPVLPLPSLLLACFVVAAVHLKLTDVGALLSERSVLVGASALEGWLPGAYWLGLELRIFGDAVASYRVVSLVLELLALVATAWLLRGRLERPGAAVLALAAYWIHPLRTEVVGPVWLRPMLIAELLVLSGFALGMASRGLGSRLAAAGLAAVGALAAPVLAALAVPALLAPVRPGLRWAMAGGLIGAALPLAMGLRSLHPAPSLPELVGLGAGVLLDPRDLGWFLGPRSPALGGWLAAVLVVLAALAGRAWLRVAGCGLGVLAALVSALSLRPARADQSQLGEALTPEVFAPAAALLLAAVVVVAQRGGLRGLLPIAVLLGLAPLGLQRVQAFSVDEPEFLAHALEKAPDSTRLHVLAGDAALRGIESRPPNQWYPHAERALRHADQALRRGGGFEAQMLRVLALSYLGKPREARELADAVLAGGTDDWRRLLLRGDVERIAQDRLQTVRWYRAALNRTDRPVVRLRYDNALDACRERIAEAVEEGRPEAGRRLAASLMEVAPEERDVAELWAHCSVELRELDAAHAAYREVLQRFPNSLVALKGLIGLAEVRGDEEEARRYRERLLRVGGRAAFEEAPPGGDG